MKEPDTNNFKSGFVAILGRPNVGKSTLLNYLIGKKVSIISSIPQTTRYQIRGILNLENAQIAFVDTPGIHSFKDELAVHLNTIAKKAISGCDLILYVVDTSRSIGREEEMMVKILARQKIKIIMVLNKIDLKADFIAHYIDLWQATLGEEKIKSNPLLYYLPLSAKTGKNVDKLKEAILENLPCGHPYYEADTLTDFPLKFRLADIIREKLCLNLKKELPHSLAVEVQEIEEKETFTYIKAIIYVKQSSQRKIVLGKKGEMIKNIGVAARQEIEVVLNRKVYLDTWVKVLGDWQKSPRILKELGYWWT